MLYSTSLGLIAKTTGLSWSGRKKGTVKEGEKKMKEDMQEGVATLTTKKIFVFYLFANNN